MDWSLFYVAIAALLSTCQAYYNSTADESMATSVNDFGFRMLKEMSQRGEANAVLGAASLVGVLGMTMMGSVGGTYDELAQALGFPQDILSSGSQHGALGGMLKQLAGGSGLAQAAAAAKGARVRPSYRSLLDRFYHADILDADFKESKKSMEMINTWVSLHTAGLIPKLVRQPLPAQTQLVLLSAHHFRDAWEKPFVPEFTRTFNFKTKNGSVPVDLMLNIGEFNYYFSEKYHCHIVALEYVGGATLHALMPWPARRHTLPDVLARLDWQAIDEIRANMTNQSVVMRFPKMRLSWDGDLRAQLQALGVSAMFDATRANFALALEGEEPQTKFTDAEDELLQRAAGSRLGEGAEREDLRARLRRLEARAPPVHVDAVLHEANINFDEWGTEASAASSGVMARTAQRFVTDAPFFLFIRDNRSGLVTFSAIVNDPTASSGVTSTDVKHKKTTS